MSSEPNMEPSDLRPNRVNQAETRTHKLLRLSAYVGCVCLLSAGFLLHRAHAELSEKALTVGRELTRAQGVHAGTTRLRLNGAEVALNSSSVATSVQTVLERFVAQCSSGAPDVQAELALATQQGARLPDAKTFGILRSLPNDSEGTAACFVRERRDGLRGLFADLERAVESGDLSKLGQLRYVYARKSTRGEGTHVISVWSRGALQPGAMFPESGDAPGSDLVPGVRPAGATRLLSAEGIDQKFQAVFYQTDRAPGEALLDYDRGLRTHGYAAQLPKLLDGAVPLPTRVYRKNDEDELLVIADRQHDRTTVFSFRLNTHGNVRFSQ